MIIIIDNSLARAQKIFSKINSVGNILTTDISIYPNVNREKKCVGDWNDHIDSAVGIFKDKKFLFIHLNNDFAVEAVDLFLRYNNTYAITYSGEGISNFDYFREDVSKFYACPEQIITGDEDYWDYQTFSDCLKFEKGNPLYALTGFDPELEKLLEPFQNKSPFDENISKSKSKLLEYINNKIKSLK